jgi:hypothetical protein
MVKDISSKEEKQDAPEQSYRWLRHFLTPKMQPWLRGLRKEWQLRSLEIDEPFRTVFPYTQVSLVRQKK